MRACGRSARTGTSRGGCTWFTRSRSPRCRRQAASSRRRARGPRACCEWRTSTPASRDEALWRRCSDARARRGARSLLGARRPGERRRGERSRRCFERTSSPLPTHEPFDESAEDEMHPLLVDAGLGAPAARGARSRAAPGRDDRVRGRARVRVGALRGGDGHPAACHISTSCRPSGRSSCCAGWTATGCSAAPLVVWADGDETYLDYIVRGVRRAAKLPERDEEE